MYEVSSFWHDIPNHQWHQYKLFKSNKQYQVEQTK